MIIDTDAACEADDPFAIVQALLSPKLIVKGILAEHFGVSGSMMESFNEVLTILDTMEMDVPVFKGQIGTLEVDGNLSEAADFIVNMIRFPIFRLVCDPERFRDDSEEIMTSVGMGAVYTACSDGKELRTITASHKEEILTRYYDPYHKELEDTVENKIKTYGK